MTAMETIELMDPVVPKKDQSNLQVPDLLHAEAVIDDEQETNILRQLEDDNMEWDVSTRRKLKNLGFSFDSKGNHIARATLIPDYLAEAHHIAADILLKHGLNHQLNQCTVAIYEPGVGVGYHKENAELAESVVTVGLGGSVPICFSPPENSEPEAITVYGKNRELLALTGECLQVWKHVIRAALTDKLEGESVKRTRRTALIFRCVKPPPIINE